MGLYKKGKNWFIDYRYPPGRAGKRIREKVGPVKDEARILLAERLQDIRMGRNPVLRIIKPRLFEDVVTEFLMKHVGVAVEVRREEGVVQVRRKANLPVSALKKDLDGYIHNVTILVRHFEAKILQQITPKAIEDFIAVRLADGVSKATANRQRSVLSKIFNWAIDRGYYGGENPVRKVVRFAESPGRVRFLTKDEATNLFMHASRHLKPVIVTALHTGGRRREILGLKWEDVDLDRGVLYFDQTNTKSGKQREVPIDDELAAVLRDLGKVRAIAGDGREFVFTWNRTKIISIKTAFETARIGADLGEDVTFHTLRHTFASWYMINGGDLYRLQKYLGHSTITLTQRYAHLSPDYLKAGAQFFGAPAANGGHPVDTKAGSGQRSASTNP